MDMDTRCVKCQRFAYMCGEQGEETASGFICVHCIPSRLRMDIAGAAVGLLPGAALGWTIGTMPLESA